MFVEGNYARRHPLRPLKFLKQIVPVDITESKVSAVCLKDAPGFLLCFSVLFSSSTLKLERTAQDTKRTQKLPWQVLVQLGRRLIEKNLNNTHLDTQTSNTQTKHTNTQTQTQTHNFTNNQKRTTHHTHTHTNTHEQK